MEHDASFWRFARGLIETRARSGLFCRSTHWSEEEVTWLGPKGAAPRWDKQAAPFACRIHAGMLVLANPGERQVAFRLPGPDAWRLVADTAAPPPGDFHERGLGPLCEGVFDLADRSLAVFLTNS